MKKPKEVICSDLGNVLLHIDTKAFESLIKPDHLKTFVDLINLHDSGQIDAIEMYKQFNETYFREKMAYTDFVKAQANCFPDINWPVFYELLRHKENGAKLVCITDVNQLVFDIIAMKFPEIFELFRDETSELRWVLSWRLKSLKRNRNPFIFAERNFGFSARTDAVFIDDLKENITAAIAVGFPKSSCFYYDMDKANTDKKLHNFLKTHCAP